jgi:hypothetical protein
MHENCIAFKLDRPIDLGSGLKITKIILLRKKKIHLAIMLSWSTRRLATQYR